MERRNGNEGGTVREDGCICPDVPPPPPPEEEECKTKRLNTCPYDPRFPNQNTTKRCFYSFVDYQRCARLLGDYPGCLYFLKCYRSLCPIAWQDRWFRQMENNIFPQKIYPPKPIIYPSKTNPFCDEDIDEEEPVFEDEC